MGNINKPKDHLSEHLKLTEHWNSNENVTLQQEVLRLKHRAARHRFRRKAENEVRKDKEYLKFRLFKSQGRRCMTFLFSGLETCNLEESHSKSEVMS